MMNLCSREGNYDPRLIDFFVNNHMIFANTYMELRNFFFHGAYQFNSSIQRVGRNQKNDTNSARDSLCMNINQVSAERSNVNGSYQSE